MRSLLFFIEWRDCWIPHLNTRKSIFPTSFWHFVSRKNNVYLRFWAILLWILRGGCMYFYCRTQGCLLLPIKWRHRACLSVFFLLFLLICYADNKFEASHNAAPKQQSFPLRPIFIGATKTHGKRERATVMHCGMCFRCQWMTLTGHWIRLPKALWKNSFLVHHHLFGRGPTQHR